MIAPSRVRIPISPPYKQKTPPLAGFFVYAVQSGVDEPSRVRQIGRKADLDADQREAPRRGEGHGWPESIPRKASRREGRFRIPACRFSSAYPQSRSPPYQQKTPPPLGSFVSVEQPRKPAPAGHLMSRIARPSAPAPAAETGSGPDQDRSPGYAGARYSGRTYRARAEHADCRRRSSRRGAA